MSKGHQSWLSLYHRLGKQPISSTKDKPIIVKHGDLFFKARLVFVDNGSSFYLEIINEVDEDEI